MQSSLVYSVQNLKNFYLNLKSKNLTWTQSIFLNLDIEVFIFQKLIGQVQNSSGLGLTLTIDIIFGFKWFASS